MNTTSSPSTANGTASNSLPVAAASADKLTAKAGDYVGQAAEAAHRNLDKLAEAGHPAIDKVAARAHGAIDIAEGTANQAVGALAGASKSVAQGVEKLKETHQHAVDASRAHVRDSPLVAVAIAAGVGYVLGRIFSPR